MAIATEDDELSVVKDGWVAISCSRAPVLNLAVGVLLWNWPRWWPNRRSHSQRSSNTILGRIGECRLCLICEWGTDDCRFPLALPVGHVCFVEIVEWWSCVFDQEWVHHGDRGRISEDALVSLISFLLFLWAYWSHVLIILQTFLLWWLFCFASLCLGLLSCIHRQLSLQRTLTTSSMWAVVWGACRSSFLGLRWLLFGCQCFLE